MPYIGMPTTSSAAATSSGGTPVVLAAEHQQALLGQRGLPQVHLGLLPLEHRQVQPALARPGHQLRLVGAAARCSRSAACPWPPARTRARRPPARSPCTRNECAVRMMAPTLNGLFDRSTAMRSGRRSGSQAGADLLERQLERGHLHDRRSLADSQRPRARKNSPAAAPPMAQAITTHQNQRLRLTGGGGAGGSQRGGGHAHDAGLHAGGDRVAGGPRPGAGGSGGRPRPASRRWRNV